MVKTAHCQSPWPVLKYGMLRFFIPVILVFAGFLPGQDEKLPPVRSERSMQAELELMYKKYRLAVIGKNLPAWKEAVAMYRRVLTQNQIISRRHPFPEALFEDPMRPPTLDNLKLLDIKTRRVTASAIYFGKADFGVIEPAEIKNIILVLLFLKEEGAWRFDNFRIVRLGENRNVLHQIRLNDMSFLDGDEFQPLDSVPPIIQPCKTPELLGEARITSFGYETEIWINGIRHGKIGNNTGRELVLGGVNRGNNIISVRTRKIDPPEKFPNRLEIAIYAAKNPKEQANRVFHFSPKAKVEPVMEMGFSGRVLMKKVE